MAKSLRYFSHYFQEIQTTKEKFKDYIIRNEAETEKLIELTDLKPVLNDLESEEPLDEKAVLIKNIQEKSAIAGKQEKEAQEKKAFLEVQNKEIAEKKAEADEQLAIAEPIIAKA